VPGVRDENPLQREGSARRGLLGSSRIPVTGLALAPWWRATRLPGASQGQNPLRVSGYCCPGHRDETSWPRSGYRGPHRLGTPSAHPPWRRPEGIMRQLESEA